MRAKFFAVLDFHPDGGDHVDRDALATEIERVITPSLQFGAPVEKIEPVIENQGHRVVSQVAVTPLTGGGA